MIVDGRRAVLVLALAALISFVVAGKAVSGDRSNIQPTAAGQGKARAAVVLRSDLSGSPTSGVADRATSGGGGSSGYRCSVYGPQQSDLVQIGAAASVWKTNGGTTVLGESAVLKTPAMASLAWPRIFASEMAFAQCARHQWASDRTSAALPLSYQRLTFPSVRARLKGYRIKTQYRDQSGRNVPAILDTVFISRGSVISSVVVIAAASRAADVHRDEIRITRRIIQRIAETPVG